ncbi:arginine biosynthesis bifunctional protein ARG7, mitochondrial precursor [Purpureocillium lavendulum]|uniref:Arginine biosynthesis bifunctional protein ARG7, mitochondrial n=1 Tax=Purpureocillium lavendulum TaxID=1247861 RepID=A0AB34FHP9_9HYPO|nr:arginine biosynthesis bifunctional protein ARG7, mitochondrial precursor [Purpureocillium lavendulum]
MSPSPAEAQREARPGVESLAAADSSTTVADSSRPDNDEMLSLPHIEDGLAAPALPAKSALRASRLLNSLPQKASPEERPILPHAAPHQVYLSSEEDASSSADDFSDFDDLDSDSEQSQRSGSTRASHEDTARIVTFVFHGRPSIVELPPRSLTPGSTSSTSLASSRRPSTGITRVSTEPTMFRTRSISSSSTLLHPPRSSSMKPKTLEKKRPMFLTIDPFAPKVAEAEEPESARAPPKTPTGMLRKTLSLVKKRSRPVLNQADGNPRESLSLQVSPMAQLGEEDVAISPREVSPATQAPTSYQDIMRGAKRSAEAAPRTESTTPQSPSTHKSRFRSGLSMSRPRSIRA